MKRYYFTSESVTEGHPDKVCDKISDAILDAYLSEDKSSRVACETLAKSGMIVVAGEITSTATPDIKAIVRETVREIGYTDKDESFNADSVEIITNIVKQSPDIAMGVDKSLETKEQNKQQSLGAGDQGMMFGYASEETKELMPLAISSAHAVTKKLTEVRKNGILSYLRPDGKSQVTVEYQDGKPKRIDTVVVSTQHSADIDIEVLRKDIKEKVIVPSLPQEMLDDNTKFLINPTGRFVTGGPEGDCGLTGRKIIVDTYGGAASHGGGAFSGKDPTKVDRSAAYMARYVAKNIVAAKLASRCEVQLAYAIGVASPVSVFVETYGTETVEQTAIEKAVKEVFDLTPSGIIEQLDLLKPIYKQLAAYGHIGREELSVKFEQTDKVDQLKKAVQV